MARAHIKRRELVGFVAALGIFSAVAILAYRSIDAAADTLGWVEHTHVVMQQLEDVSGAYARAVSARRAYVVAGDAAQLGENAALDARLAQAVGSLRASVADDADQLRRVDALSGLFGQRLRSLDGAVDRRRLGETAGESADSLDVVTKIRAVREEMEQEENRLVTERDGRTRRDMERTKIAEVVGTLASVAILLLVFRRLRREIVRRHESEEALRSSERFLDSIVENIPAMVFVKEAGELRFERINRAGEQLLGLERQELVHKNDFDFFPAEQAEAFQARDRETLAGRVLVDIPEEPIQTKQGERWLHTKKVPVLDEEGVPQYLLGISEDITEERRVAAELEAAKDAAEAANKELEAFSYSVAHDLRAPLRSIDGFSQALQEDCEGQLDASALSYLSRVRASAQQMGQLIDGLLGLSRLSRGDLATEKVDLTHIAEQIRARLEEAQPDRKVDMVIEKGLATRGDSRLLSAALENLVSNAWKFTSKQDHARIEVGKKMEDGRPVFFVRDDGAGFEQAYAHKLFGAFQRLHTTSEFEGTGIGLATVHRIVRRHGGRVWAEGEVGRGATFYFTL